MSSTLVRTLLSAAFALGGLAAMVSAGYLLLLAVAALVRRPPSGPVGPRPRLAVLVPAHDEERLVARCVHSLRDQDYPTAFRRLIVVADNCTDPTAGGGARGGAEGG